MWNCYKNSVCTNTIPQNHKFNLNTSGIYFKCLGKLIYGGWNEGSEVMGFESVKNGHLPWWQYLLWARRQMIPYWSRSWTFARILHLIVSIYVVLYPLAYMAGYKIKKHYVVPIKFNDFDKNWWWYDDSFYVRHSSWRQLIEASLCAIARWKCMFSLVLKFHRN